MRSSLLLELLKLGGAAVRRLLLCVPFLSLLMAPQPEAVRLRVARTEPVAVVPDDHSPLPDQAEMERLARTDPIAFLENCLRRYQRTVKGYACTFQKQERLSGTLQRTEVIQAFLLEQPFSVLFRWLEGARLAEAALYVEGENNGKMLARPSGKLQRALAGEVVTRDPEGADARKSGRYTIKEFGLRKGTLRTLRAWKAAQADGTLHVEFLGEKVVKEAGNRLCWVLRRDRYAKPEDDGVTELTIYIDQETWFQVGSVLKGEEGKVIGAYFFRDIKLNPDFKSGLFTRAGLVR